MVVVAEPDVGRWYGANGGGGRPCQVVGGVVRPGGVLAAVLNHPLFAAPASGPIVDQDGELFWRWGRYLSGGSITEPVEGGSVTFHHRPMAELLNMAADAGWVLEHMIERAIDQHMPVPQDEIPLAPSA